MKKLYVLLILIIFSTTAIAQHWEVPRHFPMLGIDIPGIKEVYALQTPLFFKSPVITASKSNSNCIDTLYVARFTTNFLDVLDRDSAFFISGYASNERHLILDPDNPTLLVRMKVDYSGNVLWQRIDSLMRGDHFTMYNTSIIQTADQHYVQMGVVINDYNDYKDYDIHIPVYIKFDTNGDTLWRKMYVDTANMHSGDWPQDIIAENNGGFTVTALLGSDSKHLNPYDTSDHYLYVDSTYVGLIRYDSLGNITQRKKHFVGGEKVPISIGILMKQKDGGYIVGGVNQFNGSNNPANYYLFKTDSLFNWQWLKTFSRNTNNEPTMGIIPIPNNKYVFSVNRADTPIVVDAYGNVYYNGYHHLGIMDSSFNIIKDSVFFIKLAPFGTSSSFYKSNGKVRGIDTSITGDFVICSQISYSYGAHLMQLDNNFNIKWSRWIADFPNFSERPYKMRRAHDGGYLIVGMTFRSGVGGWFVKTDTNGFALPNGADTLYHIGVKEFDSDSHQNNKELVIYPNPASNVFYLSVDDNEFNNGILEIYDLTGRLKKQQILNLGSNSINIQELSSGMYLVRIKSAKGKIQTGKLIVR